MILRLLLVSACLAAAAVGRSGDARAQTPRNDGVARLLTNLERALESNDASKYLALLSPTGDRAVAQQVINNIMSRPVNRAVVRERDRTHLPGTLPGNGYQILTEAFIESGGRARMLTMRLDVQRTTDEDWGVADQEVLTSLDGLHRLTLAAKQYAAKDLSVLAEDFQLVMPIGSVFVSETEEGVTGVVLIGRGDLTFKPTPETERGQVKLLTGTEMLQTRFDGVFLRMHPSNFTEHISRSALTERTVDAREFKRAEELFRQEMPKSFGLELSDLSRESWSLLPPLGDFLAEVRTRKYATLTYARSSSENEDITVFDRVRHKNLAVYSSRRNLVSRGRFFSEDDRTEYDVLDYQVDATFSPDRDWIEGQTTMKIKIKSTVLNTMSIRLAEPLNVQSIISREFGRVMSVRVRNQNTIVVTFPSTILRDTPVTLTVAYSGRMQPQVAEREAVAPTADPQQRTDAGDNIPFVAPEPNFLYSNRSYWYPQAPVSDYATATLRLTVPSGYSVVASGELTQPPIVISKPRGEGQKVYTFVAGQPVRYLAAVISRFVRIDSSTVSLRPEIPEDPPGSSGRARSEPGGGRAPADAAPGAGDAIRIAIEANPRQTAKARDLAQRSTDILRFYTSLVGDCPYPSFTLALLENTLPGGHSPAYFAALNQPLPTSPFTWRNDPTAFTNYPDFFLAHELAHQWWGQAVGWKNFHEQWLSEGFAQYFAAMYGKHQRGDEVFDGIVRQLRRWSIDESDQGPVHLGYRLGHVKGDSRIFRALVYNKGAAVLHMLRRLVGDETFFKGLRRFYSTWRFQKASTEDVRAAFEKESGRSLERFFERWIYGSAIPRIRATTQIDGTQATVTFEQLGEIFDLPVTVTVVETDGRQTDVIVPVTDRTIVYALPVKTAVREILINRDDAAVAEFVK